MIKRPRRHDEKHLGRSEDLSGFRFGMLTAVSYQGRSGRNAAWLVRCDCGAEKVVKSTNLKRQKSCGCLIRLEMSERMSSHGLTRASGPRHPLYIVWDGMKRRCHGKNPNPRYGGRGIYVCDRWRFGDGEKTGFECFLLDMGERPTRQHSIDRIDNDGPYSPHNCRWSTINEQQRNRSSNRIVVYRGKEMHLTDAIALSGRRPGTVSARLSKGWSVEDALDSPAGGRHV